MDLKEFKKQNEAEEAALAAQEAEVDEAEDTEETEQEDTQETTEAAATDTDEESDESGEESEGDNPEAADDAWMKPEEGSEVDKDAPTSLSDSQAAQIRRKYKGQVAEAKTEIETLRKEIEALKTAKPAPVVKDDKPNRDDFDTQEDYIEALVEHKHKLALNQHQTSQAAQERQKAQEREAARVNDAVGKHYLRAEKLSTRSGIKPETYQAADLKFRSSIESIFPGAGDAVTDRLIASMGEGSEKLVYHLAINDKKMQELIDKFKEDNTGIAASIHLGKLVDKLSAPVKRESSAPVPAKQLNGDRSTKAKDIVSFQKYKEAHKKGDGSLAYNIKRKAKAAGIDTKGWA